MMMKTTIATLVGIIVAFVLITLMQAISHVAYPMPESVNPDSLESLADWIAKMPMGAFMLVWLGYVVGSFGGGLAAGLIQPLSKIACFIIGGLLTLGGIMNFVLLPHPVWFVILCLVIYLPVCYFGYRTAVIKKKKINFDRTTIF